MKIWGSLIFMVVSVLLGLVVGLWWFAPGEKQVRISSEGMLQQVREVLKISTVEGQYSEIYDYKDFYYYDWYPLRKKALVKISATVSMGFDLTDVEITTDADRKEIRILGLPEPTILSRDIQHEFYDIQEGSFNSFQPDDLNKMQRDIRRIITNRVKRSELPAMAGERFDSLLGGLQNLVAPYGWAIQWEGRTSAPLFPNRLDSGLH
jgi:hypothetical protein